MTLDVNALYKETIGHISDRQNEYKKLIEELKKIITDKIDACEGTYPALRFYKARMSWHCFRQWIAIEVQEKIKLEVIATEKDLTNLTPDNVDDMIIFRLNFGDINSEYIKLTDQSNRVFGKISSN